MNSGIYKILNKVNGKFYIGSAFDFNKRFREHRYHLNKQTHKNPYLQSAWLKYWEQSFEFIILEYVICDKEFLYIREQFWIDSLKPNYNLASKAGSRAGVPMPESAKKRIGENSKRHMTGRKRSEEFKAQMSNRMKGHQWNIGRKQSPEVIANRVAKNTGQTRSEETKLKISAGNLGKKRSEETRKRMSEAAKNRGKNKSAVE